MAKYSVTEWSQTAADNTDVDAVNLGEGMAPSGVNNAMRSIMAQIASAGIFPSFKDATTLTADTRLAYTAGVGKVLVAAGDPVAAGSRSYLVLASSSTEADLTTAGGVKLDFVAGAYDGTATTLVTGTGADQKDEVIAAEAASGSLDISGTVALSSAGAAFDGTFTTAANLAGLKVGSQTIADATELRVGSRDRTGVLKAFDADEDATMVVAENIGLVDIGAGLAFDGNLADGSSGVANAFTFAGVGETRLPDMVASNYRTARVCGSRERAGGRVYVGNFRGKNATGSAALFLGKPFGVSEIIHKGLIELDGNDGAGRGGLTIDNDSTASDADQTPTSATASGTTITVNATAHGFVTGDYIVLSGANEGQYNMMGLITSHTTDSFTFTANKAPTTSPATGTLTLRPSFGPINSALIDRVSLRNTASDSSQFALKAEDGVEVLAANYVEAINVNEASASAALGVFRYGPGNANHPAKAITVNQIYAKNTHMGSDIIVGHADYQSMNFPDIRMIDAGIGVNVSPQNDIAYHGTISRLLAKVEKEGFWTGSTRGHASIITNSDSGEYIVQDANISVPMLRDGNSGVISWKGVEFATLNLGTFTGGFTEKDVNPSFSGTYVRQRGAVCVGGARVITINCDGYMNLGGSGLTSGDPNKSGNGFELHATDTIIINGGIFDGGVGDNQISDSLIRFSVLETPADQDTLCRIIINGATFRNANNAINIDNVDSVPSGKGYELVLSNCKFETTVTTGIQNQSRFRSVIIDGVTQ